MPVRLVPTVFFTLMLTSSFALGDTTSSRLSPREALGQLKVGNDRFARNASKPVSLSLNRRREVAASQKPWAMVLSCADARVPPEHVFNVGLGDLYVVRSAGTAVDRSILASLEFGASQLHIPLLVVMGHDACDVVHASATPMAANESQNLDYVLKAIQTAKKKTDAAPQDVDQVKALVLDNVEQVVNDTLAKSPLVRGLVDAGELEIVGAYYESLSGRVVFSEPVTPAPSTNVISAAQPAKAVATPAASHAH
jgi:carbonic anhydrase